MDPVQFDIFAVAAAKKAQAATPRPASPPPFSPAEGRRLRDEGLERAADAAERGGFLEDAYRILYALALRQAEVTADDLYAAGLPEEQTNRNAMGSLFTRAAREGVLVFTGRIVQSQRVARHASSIRVWRSLVYRGAADVGT